MQEKYKHLKGLKAKLDIKKPLEECASQRLQEELFLEYTYNSNAIEGNSLDIIETKCILRYGLAIEGKSLREHIEVINHDKAITLLEDLVKNQQPVNEKTVKTLHDVVLKSIDDKHAGKWRPYDVYIPGASHKLPCHKDVPTLMQKFFDWYQTDAQNLLPVERAARVHTNFVNIHPFVDGNGRTARLLMNLELLKAGYPLAIVKQEEKNVYYKSLDMAAHGDYRPFTEIVCELVEETFKKYFYVFGS